MLRYPKVASLQIHKATKRESGIVPVIQATRAQLLDQPLHLVAIASLHQLKRTTGRRHIAQRAGFEDGTRPVQTTCLVGRRALDKYGGVMTQMEVGALGWSSCCLLCGKAV